VVETRRAGLVWRAGAVLGAAPELRVSTLCSVYPVAPPGAHIRDEVFIIRSNFWRITPARPTPAGWVFSPTIVGQDSPLRVPRSASDPGRIAGRCFAARTPGARTLIPRVNYPPAFVGSPKQGARPSARLCDGVGCAARPRAPSLQEPSPLGDGYKESPRLRLALAMLDAPASALQAKWGHGVGRQARQMRGEIVSTCKDLRVRSKSAGAYTGICHRLCPVFAPIFLFLERIRTHEVRVEYLLESIRDSLRREYRHKRQRFMALSA
jgi:hypothetical protein